MAEADAEDSRPLLLELLKQFGLQGNAGLIRAKSVPPSEDSFFNNVIAFYLTDEELVDLPGNDGRLLDKKFILLPKKKKDDAWWFPGLWVDLSKPGHLSIQLVVMALERRFGFRWESPESEAGEQGDHDYWHLQPIDTIRRAERDLSLELKHNDVCTHFPTVPVDANNSIQLLDALMVSLYGPKYSAEFITESAIREQLHTHSGDRLWASARSISKSDANPPSKTKAKDGKNKGKK